jgi:hypothetical protein
MSEHQLEELLDYGQVRVFESASVSTCVFRLKKGAPGAEARFSLMKSLEKPEFVNLVPAGDLAHRASWIPLVADANTRSALSVIKRPRNLKDLGFTSSAAATVSEAYKIAEYLKDDANPKSNQFKLVNTGSIDPYKSLWGERKTKYLGLELMHPVISRLDLESVSVKRLTQSSSPKLIAIGMGNVEVFMDLKGEYCAGKTTSVLFPPKGKESILLPFALALLNSRVSRFWFKTNFLAGGMSGLSPENLLTMPVPEIAESQLEEIASLAELNQKNPSEQLSEDISNRIEQAFGLNEEMLAVFNG